MSQSAKHILFFVVCLVALAALCHTYLYIGLPEVDDDTRDVIVHGLRLPRMLCALGVGSLLSVAGAIMQGVFRNPLVEPYTMGVSGGAVVGVALAFISGSVAAYGSVSITLAAALGGLLTLAVVLLMRRAVGYDTGVMLICGIMISFVSSAVTTVLLALASREDVSQVISWSVGSFDGVGEAMSFFVAAVGLLATLLSVFLGNVVNVLSLGDAEARSLGVAPGRAAGWLFVIATLLAAVSVSAAGVVAFVGMAVPHLARTLCGSDNRVVLPASGLLGSLVMMACDLVAKTVISPRELPAGAVCAVAGGVMFIYMTVRWKKRVA